VPGTAAGWSATHRSARKGTAGCQNTPYTTYDPKGVLKKAGCNTAGDAYTALNEYMYWLLEQAAKHAKANGRKTLRAPFPCSRGGRSAGGGEVEVGRRDADRVADADVCELAAFAEQVHGRGADAEQLGDLEHGEQRRDAGDGAQASWRDRRRGG